MTQYFLGADLGGTKTHVLLADETGRVLGFGRSGPGNHETVGMRGFRRNLNEAVTQALTSAGIRPDQVSGSGYGIGGYDWPIERPMMLRAIKSLGLSGTVDLVNDCELGILSSSPRGWGLAVVSGTGCNCRGWDETRTRMGRVTGGGMDFGEFAGASELMFMVSRAIAYDWTGRGPKTALSTAFVKQYGMKDVEDLLQAVICRKLYIDASAAPLVFQVAAEGDPVAVDLIRWAGRELGEMAVTVIRQLGFEEIDFDLVQIGRMFDGSPILSEEMKKVVMAVAPRANFIRSHEPPVMGAVILAVESTGRKPGNEFRRNLSASIPTSITYAGEDV